MEKEVELEHIRLHVLKELGNEEVYFLWVSFQDEQLRLHLTSLGLDLMEHNLNH